MNNEEKPYKTRIDTRTRKARAAGNVGLKVVYHHVNYIGLERLTPHRHGPLLLLPKHQRRADIPIVARLGQRINRLLYFAMKESLPEFLESMGGRSVPQADADDMRAKYRGAQRLYQDIEDMLREGEAYVIMPEGKRNPRPHPHATPEETARYDPRIERGIMKGIMRVQENLGESIPLVAIDIKYTRSNLREHAHVIVAEPFSTNNLDLLEDYLCANIFELKHSQQREARKEEVRVPETRVAQQTVR